MSCEDREIPLFVGGLALVRDQAENGKASWLVRQEEQGQPWRLIEAPCLEGETIRDAVKREATWTLGLDPKKDVLVSQVPRAHLHVEYRPEAQERPEGQYQIEFYVIDLYSKTARQTIDADARNRWISAAELQLGLCNDGQTLDRFQHKFITKAAVVNSWGEDSYYG